MTTVLVVDDEPIVRDVIVRYLKRDGFSTLEAAAMLLARLEDKPEIEATLIASFERLLARYRALHPGSAAGHGR